MQQGRIQKIQNEGAEFPPSSPPPPSSLHPLADENFTLQNMQHAAFYCGRTRDAK